MKNFIILLLLIQPTVLLAKEISSETGLNLQLTQKTEEKTKFIPKTAIANEKTFKTKLEIYIKRLSITRKCLIFYVTGIIMIALC